MYLLLRAEGGFRGCDYKELAPRLQVIGRPRKLPCTVEFWPPAPASTRQPAAMQIPLDDARGT
jgi:hypothetical protein